MECTMKSEFSRLTDSKKQSLMDISALLELEFIRNPDGAKEFEAMVQRCGDKKTLSGEYESHEDIDEPDTDEGN